MKLTPSALPAQHMLFHQWLPTQLQRYAPASRHCPRTRGVLVLWASFSLLAPLLLHFSCSKPAVQFQSHPFPPKLVENWSYTPLEKGLLMCSLAGDFNSVGCSFPSQRAFISWNWVILVSSGWNADAEPAPLPAVSPVPLVPSPQDFTCGPALAACTLSALRWQLLFCISTRAVFSMVCLPWPAVINISPLIFPRYCWNLCICWWFRIVNINPDKSVWPFAPMSKGKNRPLQWVAAQHWVIHTSHRNNAEIPHSFYRYFFRRWSVSLPWQHSLGKLRSM